MPEAVRRGARGSASSALPLDRQVVNLDVRDTQNLVDRAVLDAYLQEVALVDLDQTYQVRLGLRLNETEYASLLVEQLHGLLDSYAARPASADGRAYSLYLNMSGAEVERAVDMEVPLYLGRWVLSKDPSVQVKGTRRVKRTSSRPKIVVTADGRGVVGHAGARLLADLADATGLSAAMSEALAPLRQRDRGHDPGRVAVDLAVMLADGGEAIADLAVLRNQSELFGPVASDATAWRVLDAIDAAALDRIRAARARARELAWAQAAETGRLPASTVGGFTIPGFVLDIDATIVICHSEKESAAKTWKKTFGYHPLLCFLDATGEALAGILRAGQRRARTPPPTTSRCWTWRWRRSPTTYATARTS